MWVSRRPKRGALQASAFAASQGGIHHHLSE
jgi:hypothetical protein